VTGEALGFYGPDQAWIHDARFGDLARSAAEMVLARLRAAGLATGTVVDLGCGSGILAGLLVDAGYDVVGVDLSPAMIELARRRAPGARFHRGSVHDFPLPAGAVAVTAVGEVLGYATDPTAGVEAFAALAVRAHAALVPGGLFTCDVATPGRYGPGRAAERVHDHDSWFLGMRADESDDGTRLDRRITIFRRTRSGEYRRTAEHHVLRLYDPATLAAALESAGFEASIRSQYAGPSASTPGAGWAVLLATKP
jgi:SAM-dependent methyltransferase